MITQLKFHESATDIRGDGGLSFKLHHFSAVQSFFLFHISALIWLFLFKFPFRSVRQLSPSATPPPPSPHPPTTTLCLPPPPTTQPFLSPHSWSRQQSSWKPREERKKRRPRAPRREAEVTWTDPPETADILFLLGKINHSPKHNYHVSCMPECRNKSSSPLTSLMDNP